MSDYLHCDNVQILNKLTKINPLLMIRILYPYYELTVNYY